MAPSSSTQASLSVRAARRLALARAGLLKPAWTGLTSRAAGRGKRALDAVEKVVRRFGYLQLDTVSIAGARSHGIVLLSRIEGLDPAVPEELLRPGRPYFEYWGHEASWLPMELYPHFRFRREEFCEHPWWGDLIGEHPEVARGIVERIREEGPLRSADLEGASRGGWWNLKLSKKIATALWSSGRLAIRERRNFQRTYDLAERVIPQPLRETRIPFEEALGGILLQALSGHGWATQGTLASTWRLSRKGPEIRSTLERLAEEGEVVSCELRTADDRRPPQGWIRPRDLDLADRLERIRPGRDRGVLLSPFDPVLWDRDRVRTLFGFEQVLEIFKPAPQRKYGYYCLPVLAGERLVGRVDLKADRKTRSLAVLSRHFESESPDPRDHQAVHSALDRYAAALGLEIRSPDRIRIPATGE